MYCVYCYTQACSSCSKWRVLSSYDAWAFHCRMPNASHCILSLQSMRCRHAGFSGCSARGLAALWHVESPQTRDPTHVPYIGSHIPNHWTIREVQDSVDAISISTFLTQRWYDCPLCQIALYTCPYFDFSFSSLNQELFDGRIADVFMLLSRGLR